MSGDGNQQLNHWPESGDPLALELNVTRLTVKPQDYIARRHQRTAGNSDEIRCVRQRSNHFNGCGVNPFLVPSLGHNTSGVCSASIGFAQYSTTKVNGSDRGSACLTAL